ncbi:MAG: hypothetical protein LBE02_05155 [Spirochaetaceae bacterium]|jgi:hypothetical protein|nr:hypothetical protein [Spirochaetaceae bacterium]
MSKNIFFIVFFIFLILDIAPDENWPQIIDSPLVSDYITSKENVTSNDLEQEYNYILDFLEKAIEACEYNINNRYYRFTLTKKVPILENNRLKVIETDSIQSVWDIENNSFYDETDVLEPLELLNMIRYAQSYNQLIEYWYEKTGEKLRETIDIGDKLYQYILISAKCQRTEKSVEE